ncbi:MAG TPA: serine hydrolase domain-containing protein [Candidatus Rubrimentiphilum sp.]|nr:serine hydrolase domain-containing protein [Candidatus Rubrimentiphilum sp.]
MIDRIFKYANLVLVLMACAASPATPARGLDPLVRMPIAGKVYPGISVAVGNSTGLLAANAFGDANIAASTPMTPQTPLRMASVSKSITAAAILMLDQAGAISIDKPVLTYVPQFTSNGAKITLRQLLAQISGIPGRNHGDPILHGDGPITQAQFFTKLNATPLYATPGTQWDYANENYYLLAQVVQNVGHASFASWLKQHIFVPAGMMQTYSDEGAPDPALAVGYVHRLPQDPFLACAAPDWSGELGAGGVISTPSDLVRFDIALFNGTLLDAAHRKEMLAPAFPLPGGASMALGWFVQPNSVVFHEGDFTIAAAINAIFPDGTYVAEASNAADLGPDFDRSYFTRQVQNMYGTTPIALGSPNPPSLLSMIGPFSTCAQLDAMLFGH